MSHTVEILCVGTELLLGDTVNTNAPALARELSALGLNVYYHTAVGDNPARLTQAVRLAQSRADILITTGGLGPTCDDLTMKTVAAAFGTEMAFRPEVADTIRAHFLRYGRGNMPENNLQQAWLPVGGTVLPNDHGTAPGCAFEVGGMHIILLPGPPRECLPMFQTYAVPYLQKLAEGVLVSRRLRMIGIGESAMEERVRTRMNELTNPTLAPYAKEGECELRITAKAGSEHEANALIAPVEAEMRALFASYIYGVDVDSIEAVVLKLLQDKGLTMGTAESCTGGLIAKRITDLPGAACAFRGGVVSYAVEVKQDVLGVAPEMIDAHSAVSEPVACAMAEGARRVLGCDIAVSVTGVAGPDPDDRGNPVGLVYIALAAEGFCVAQRLNLGTGRARIRIHAANRALDMVRRYLT